MQFALEAAHATGQMHQQEPVLLKASRTLFWREAQSFDGDGNIKREKRQLEPSSIDCKVLAGHVSAGQSVFDFIMHMLHGAGFFPVPVKTLNRFAKPLEWCLLVGTTEPYAIDWSCRK